MKLAKLELTDSDYLGFEQFFLVPDKMTAEEWVLEVEIAIASIPTNISVKHLIYKARLLEYAAAELAEKFEPIEVEIVCNYTASEMDIFLPLPPETKQRAVEHYLKLSVDDPDLKRLYDEKAEKWEEII